jgi:hypothetical protein
MLGLEVDNHAPPKPPLLHPSPMGAKHKRSDSASQNGVNPHEGLTQSHKGCNVQDSQGGQIVQLQAIIL